MPTALPPPPRAASGPTLRTLAALPSVRGWVLAVTVYFLAVFHRSSLGVAGMLAERRFGITDGQLGTFVLLQIGVYALMQVPTGVLVDRYGSRRLLVVASSLMGLGQLLFALAPSFPSALLARGLLGCGDAMTFVSVLRFAAAHFSARRYPVLVAVTGTIGTAGNVLATLPLSMLLGSIGWTSSYGTAGVLSLVAAVGVWALLDDRSVRPRRLRGSQDVRAGIVAVNRRVRAAWALPGTRLGYWVHFTTMTVATTFGVLWGHPYLVDGLGFSTSAAGTVLMLGVLFSGIAGPPVGWLVGRFPRMRIVLVLAVSVLTTLFWALTVLLLGDTPPRALVATLFVLTMIGGPVSGVAFSVARDYNSPRLVGTASGVVNVGGFVATAVSSIAFGWALNALGGSTPHALRIALLIPVVVQFGGTLRIIAWSRRVRAGIRARQDAGLAVPVPVRRRYWWDHPDAVRAGAEQPEQPPAGAEQPPCGSHGPVEVGISALAHRRQEL